MAGVERVRSEPPEDPSWRADALAGSRHSRLLDELRLPAHDSDPERAEQLCAEVARLALGDFTPALILLPAALRRRAQALAAYTLTLFDFAAQSGLDGERLAQINRWEFELEASLEARPEDRVVGQPVFVCMNLEERRQPWNRDALDEIAAAARRRAIRERPATATALIADSDRLARGLAAALGGPEAAEAGAALGGALLRIASLLRLGESLRRRRPPLPRDELPDEPGGSPDRERLVRAIAAETDRLGKRLNELPDLARLPPELRAGARYARRAARALLGRIEALGPALVDRPPVLGAGSRIRLLLVSRLGL